VVNGLPGALNNPGSSATYQGFHKPPLIPGVSKTPVNTWGSENPH